MPARTIRNFQAMLRGWLDDGVFHLSDFGPPTDGASGTGAGKCGPASLYFDATNGVVYNNVGSKSSPSWRIAGIERAAEVTITNAEMLALRATPKTLVAAPGAGKFLKLHGGILLFDRTAVYSETADNMAVRLGGTAGVIVSQTIESTGFVDAAADAITTIEPKLDALGVKTLVENLPLSLHNTGDGEFGGGNAANVVRAKIFYSIWASDF